MTRGRIAILIDGGFFLKRLNHLVDETRRNTPANVVSCIREMCRNHIQRLTNANKNNWQQHVYRIFFYDANPYDGKAHHPLDNRQIDFGKSDVARFRLELFQLLRKERKLALRLGKVTKEHDWSIHPSLTKKLLRKRHSLDALDKLKAPISKTQAEDGTVTLSLTADEVSGLIELRESWQSLNTSSVSLGLRQKGVDMKIGVDITSIALKQQAETIILIAGDSDFVPASKLARREGLEFILDPMWQQVNADLFEHIDGLQSGLPKPVKNASNTTS